MINYNFYPEIKFILTILYGEVTPVELRELIDELHKIDQPEGNMRGLVVFCQNANSKKIKTSDILSAGERMRHVNFRKNSKNAIVTKSLLAYGLSRMYKVATDILNMDELNIYKQQQLEEAIQWLELDNNMKEKIIKTIDDCETTSDE